MRLLTRGWAAVTAMIDIAMHDDSGPVTLAEIGGRQKISISYLEQLFHKLRRSSLVESVRGPGGGYCLAKDIAQVSVCDIMNAVDDPLDATQCGGRANCLGDEKCISHDLWTRVNLHVSDYLGTLTLMQLRDEQRAKENGDGLVQGLERRNYLPGDNRTPPSV